MLAIRPGRFLSKIAIFAMLLACATLNQYPEPDRCYIVCAEDAYEDHQRHSILCDKLVCSQTRAVAEHGCLCQTNRSNQLVVAEARHSAFSKVFAQLARNV